MVTVPSLIDETPLDQYTATSGQTDFNFTYMIFATADIKVYVNGVLKTETTDYVVKQSDGSPIVPADDLPMDGGKVVFNSGLNSGDSVSLSRDIAIDRLTGYSVAGAFRADAVNAEFARILAIIQQLNRDLDRSITLSPSDSEGGSLQIPENRANKTLSFDSLGNLSVTNLTSNNIKVNISATSAPSSSDDSANGYSVGSSWINTTNDRLYTCLDASVGASVWGKIAATVGNLDLTNSGNNLIFSSSNNQMGIRNNTELGSDNGILVLGAAGELTSNRTAQILLYGLNATAGGDDVGGYLFLTAATAGSAGYIIAENDIKNRKGLVLRSGHALTPATGYSASDVPDPDGVLHIFGGAVSLNSDPQISGFSASANANTIVVEQANASDVGMTFAVEDGQVIRWNFAHENDAQAGAIIYDTSDDSLQFLNNSTEHMRLNSGGVLLVGKTSSNVATAGCEVNDAGIIQATRASNLACILNRITSEGDIQDWRYAGTSIAKMSVSSGESQFDVDQITFDGGSNYLQNYAEGDFTPTLYGSSTAGSPTYSFNGGHYVRVGNVVTCTFNIVLTAVGGMVGQVRIDGFPFTHKNDSNERAVANIIVYNHALTAGDLIAGWMPGNSNDIYLITQDQSDNFSEQSLLASNIDADFQVRGTVTYIIE